MCDYFRLLSVISNFFYILQKQQNISEEECFTLRVKDGVTDGRLDGQKDVHEICTDNQTDRWTYRGTDRRTWNYRQTDKNDRLTDKQKTFARFKV